ncbi:MAG: lactate utilization protein [Eubacteriales bacterium]
MNEFVEERAEKCGQTLVNALKKRHFDACFCKDKKEALAKALELIPTDDVVSWGGTFSAAEIGLFPALAGRGQPILDRATAKNREESQDIARKALTCGTFVMSANAASADGQLVNIDGNGNRVAALMFGPRQVLVILGINKICPDLESAVKRARFVAAPTNAQRFDIGTPCKSTGVCADCLCPDSICAQIVVTRICRPAGRIKVLVVGEDLGF